MSNRDHNKAKNHKLKVFSAGLSRTGTYGLSQILNAIGFGECYHGFIKFYNHYQNDFWGKIAEMNPEQRKNVNWNEFFYNYKGYGNVYNSCVDWPAAECWKEIAEFYPNCKIILGVRDAKKWYYSMTRGLYPKLNIFDYFYWHYWTNSTHRIEWNVNNKLYLDKYGGVWNMYKENLYKTKSIKLFEKHISAVKEYFEYERIKNNWKQSRLFIYDLERKDKDIMRLELLQFLDVDVDKYKDVEIKPTNSSKQLQSWNAQANRKFHLQIVTVIAWIGSATYICLNNK